MSAKMHKRTLFLAHAAVIAALYVALTYLSYSVHLSGKELFQLRFSEMLCILPYFTAAAVPGLTLGCLLANLFTAAALPDILFGTLATLLGAIGTRLLKKWRFLSPLPPILSNTLIIPFVIKFAYLDDLGIGWLFLSVGIGEVLSVGVCGTMLLLVLEKYRRHIFGEN